MAKYDMWGENRADTEETHIGSPTPMGMKVCLHRGNTPWVSNYLGTKETPMDIKIFRQGIPNGSPMGMKVCRHRGNTPWV